MAGQVGRPRRSASDALAAKPADGNAAGDETPVAAPVTAEADVVETPDTPKVEESAKVDDTDAAREAAEREEAERKAEADRKAAKSDGLVPVQVLFSRFAYRTEEGIHTGANFGEVVRVSKKAADRAIAAGAVVRVK